ncbi:MAG: SDR family NAD(P)-dependent oxidoreductase [Methylococcaceae bacterium]|nr:MAG: SDR family NAD(P)-dependent oxidoreductase [Methylococcaceae bacterium]
MHKRVALIAYSLRFPGTTTQNLWNDLIAKKDLVTEVDTSRWSKDTFLHPDKRHPGTSYTFAAGSLGDISGFDAAFFGISPREAALIDPQQRILLELAWETFENAGIVPSSLRGSDCGVYVGISNVDYAYRLADDLAAVDSAAATGIISSIAANRISYVFDLHGPSISMDTACSSSLVAFHQACMAIRSGEVSQALAGGINLHLHPYGFISFSKATMLSKTGRCHVFDESGDGYVRSEGGGLFFLKDYEQARDEGDQILALVAGSAINTDGYKSGLTIPNHHAQAALMERVYQQSGIHPDAIDYFEAHGTGTAVGDPIETQAIGAALGKKRQRPLLIGSIKSNLGHLESASGVAGLAKALHCIQQRIVPATIGITNINPAIHCEEWNLAVVTEHQPLKASGELTIGINSFGFGGANAHVILQSHQPSSLTPAALAPAPAITVPLRVSIKDTENLSASLTVLAEFLSTLAEEQFYDVAYSSIFHREHHLNNALIFSASAADACTQLTNMATLTAAQLRANSSEKFYFGNRIDQANGPVFVYSGNGCQWHEMGKALFAQSALFRSTLKDLDQLFSAYADFSLVDELTGENGNRYRLTQYAQPALFALQVGITQVLNAHGIHPVAVIGHSVGEVAAAWAAGALSLADAVKVIFYRSYHQASTQGLGGMTAVAMSAEDLHVLLAELALPEVYLAGINSVRGVTLAGAEAELSRVEQVFTARNISFRRLELDYPFHSPAMDALQDGICRDLKDLTVQRPKLPMFSTVTGAQLEEHDVDAHYWWQNIRQPVQFNAALSALLATGINVAIEIGAHPVLQRYLNDSFKAANVQGLVLPTLTKQQSGAASLQRTIALTLLSGASSSYQAWFATPGKFISLPNYVWQKTPVWHPVTVESHGLLARKLCHPLLGYPLAQHQHIWENQLDTQRIPFLADHNVGGAVVFPGAGFVEIALAAAQQMYPSLFVEIEDLDIRSPLLLSHEHSKVIRFTVTAHDGRFTLQSRELAASSEWLVHCVGRLLTHASHSTLNAQEPLDVASYTPSSRAVHFTRDTHQQLTTHVGLAYGEAFQAIEHGWCDAQQAVGMLTAPEKIQTNFSEFSLHPALLDCAFQLIFQVLKDQIQHYEGLAFVPIRVGAIYFFATSAPPVFAKARLCNRAPHSLHAEFILYDAHGAVLAVLKEVRFRAVRLHRPHSQSLTYLDYHLTARPLRQLSTLIELLPTALLHEALTQAPQQTERYQQVIKPLLDEMSLMPVLNALASVADEQGFLAESVLTHLFEEAASKRKIFHCLIHIATHYGLLSSVSATALQPEPGWQLTLDKRQAPHALTAIWSYLINHDPEFFLLTHWMGRIGLHCPELWCDALRHDILGITPNLPVQLSHFVFAHTVKKSIADAMLSQYQYITQNLLPGERFKLLEIAAYQPEFGSVLCPQFDFKLGDYSFASLNENALSAAQSLHDHYPLMTLIDLTDAAALNLLKQQPASCAIVHLAMLNIAELQTVLTQLSTWLLPNAQVLFIGLYPSAWLSVVQASLPDIWIMQGDHVLGSMQLTPEMVSEKLQALAFTQVLTQNVGANTNTGCYVITATTPNTTPTLQALNSAETLVQRWLIIYGDDAAEHQLAHALAEQLQARQQEVFKLALTGSATQQIIQQITHAEDKGHAFTHIIHLAGWASERLSSQVSRCALTVDILNALALSQGTTTLWLLTHQVAAMWAADQTQTILFNGKMSHDAALWGFARSVLNETMPNYRVRLVDIATEAHTRSVTSALLDELVYEFINADAEQEVVFDVMGKRFVPRLRQRDSLIVAQPLALLAQQPVQLGFTLPGQLKNLLWSPTVNASVFADNAIEVAVKATGLNFRDVMYTLGLLPDEAVENGFVGASLGLEFAGIIIRKGAAVTEFNVGDAVVGLGPASFSNVVVTQVNAVALLPSAMSFAAAATIPSAFFTVMYAFKQLAHLTAGEKVLIHGAAGGVGIAAIQLAHYFGAEVYATVGAEEKRDFLTLMGVKHIYDSRSLSFAEAILADTQQQGVDVILNSLSGEAINRNFRVLKPFGRFLELGKRDFYENTTLGLRPFRNNISYFGIDADQLMRLHPTLTQRIFADVMALFHQGKLHPLPYTLFDANHIVEAFRFMQQAKHIGKIVITYDKGIYLPPPPVAKKSSLKLSPKASYLVTGGLGGFGLRTADWLVEKGAKHLILLSRRGAQTEEALTALAGFAKQGVQVTVCACDITDKSALAALLSDCAIRLPPLKGIFHAAAVIEDGWALNLTEAQIERVMQPKVYGAQHLHDLTAHLSIDYFVVYSSVTTLFGNPGQAHYVAANLWLDALVAYRQQQGLAASCVALGAIDDAGYLTRNEKVKEALQNRLGGRALSSATALAIVERLLTEPAAPYSVGVMEFEWRALAAFLPAADSPKFRELALYSPYTEDTEEQREDVQRLLKELSGEALHNAFVDMLKEELSRVLLINKDKIDEHLSMYAIGLDSLMASELLMAIEARFAVHIPVMSLSELSTLHKLAEYLLSKLQGQQDGEPDTSTVSKNITHLSKQHGTSVTKEELQALVKSVETESNRRIIH